MSRIDYCRSDLCEVRFCSRPAPGELAALRAVDVDLCAANAARYCWPRRRTPGFEPDIDGSVPEQGDHGIQTGHTLTVNTEPHPWRHMPPRISAGKGIWHRHRLLTEDLPLSTSRILLGQQT